MYETMKVFILSPLAALLVLRYCLAQISEEFSILYEPVTISGNFSPASPYYAGCMLFNTNQSRHWHLAQHGFLFKRPETSSDMTIKKCLEYCWTEHNFYYAAVYPKDEETKCMCGTVRMDRGQPFAPLSNNHCQNASLRTCTGDSTQVCGALQLNDSAFIASIYKGTTYIEIKITAGDSFILYLNGKLLKVIDVRHEYPVPVFIPHMHIKTMAILVNETRAGCCHTRGVQITVDKIPIKQHSYNCTKLTEDNKYSDFLSNYPDWFTNDPADLSGAVWQPPEKLLRVPGVKYFGGEYYWYDKGDTDVMACKIEMRCTDGYFGINCLSRNRNCGGAVHPVAGYCLGSCRRGSGPFCVLDDELPTEENNPVGPCPFCSQCKKQSCFPPNQLPSSTVYYMCPISWTGRCWACEDGFWGNLCTNACSVHCSWKRCSKDTGTCDWCQLGKYGPKCNLNCPAGCVADMGCDKTSGRCLECQPGRYQDHCDKQCSNCNGEECDMEGTCKNGCKIGFYTSKCLEQCQSSCTNSSCDMNNGQCDCEAGYYGLICTKRCNQNCLREICDQYTGLCIHGCEPGFYGNMCGLACDPDCNDGKCDLSGFCYKRCRVGFYGELCTKPCPTGCRGSCEKGTGYCVVCKEGFYGDRCDATCPEVCPSSCRGNTRTAAAGGNPNIAAENRRSRRSAGASAGASAEASAANAKTRAKTHRDTGAATATSQKKEKEKAETGGNTAPALLSSLCSVFAGVAALAVIIVVAVSYMYVYGRPAVATRVLSLYRSYVKPAATHDDETPPGDDHTNGNTPQ